LYKAPSQLARRLEQKRLDRYATSTDEGWKAANDAEYSSWLPDLAKKKRLAELRRLRELAEVLDSM
jgi:hypothetical protein